jgi:hypothetical protein
MMVESQTVAPQMLMLNAPQQTRVWEGMISAEVRANYFAELAKNFHRQQRVVTWLTLVSSSGALVSILAKLPPQFSWVAPILALMTSALSFYSLAFQNEKKAADAMDLHFKWSSLANEYEQLWENMYVPDAQERFARLNEKAIDLGRLGTSFPINEKSLLKWQNRVEERRRVVPVHA